MENILQKLFDKSLILLQNKEYEQCKKILLSLIEKIPPHELKHNSFLLNNLGMCELKLNNIKNALYAFMTIYDFYKTNKRLSICYVPHMENIFNDSNNYDNDIFKYYSSSFDNIDLIYALINSYFVSDFVQKKTFLKKVNSKIDDKIMSLYFSDIYKIVFNKHDYNSKELVQQINNNFDKIINLIKLNKKTFSIYDFTIFIYTNYYYYLCYLDTNIVNLQRKYSTILSNILPEINYISPKCQKRMNLPIKQIKKKKIKLGFLSFFMADLSSVLRDRANIIKSLPKELFETHLISYGPPKPEFLEISLIKSLYDTVDYKHYLAEITDIDRSIDRKIVKYISDLDFDILVYSDIGMTIESVIFAHMRFAPIQINTWGHSVTSGISTIDYYFSSELYETQNAQENYSEKLIRMKSLCTCYPSIFINIEYKDKELLKIPKDKFILSCMQMRHKFKPEFLKMLNRILNAHPNTVVIMIRGNNIDTYIKQYIDNKDQIFFIDKCTFNVFNKYIYFSDLILDTYPFGGCNSSLEGFNFNKVIITKPSPYLSGRFTYGFYKRMNIFDTIAYDEQEYFELVSRFITDKKYREFIENKIKQKKNLLFEETASIKEWITTLIDVAKPYVLLDNPMIQYNN